MFYSQFILAKKGPLGTIWIAAHLERKLRRNQVTETNIGTSVDSILFPEVPIALRLSGHLLLGVVRIYSRKVNYLFHDCSEALVKIKQAFHSGVVDLPPEAATAPFHSITLPETFDLDDFELLPDREHSFLAKSSVDSHVTSREQITLQDPLDNSIYLDSQFGLDERFSDTDAAKMGLEFDEDLLFGKTSNFAPSPSSMALAEDVVPPTPGEHVEDMQMMSATPANDALDFLPMDIDQNEASSPGITLHPIDLNEHNEHSTLAFGMNQIDLEDRIESTTTIPDLESVQLAFDEPEESQPERASRETARNVMQRFQAEEENSDRLAILKSPKIEVLTEEFESLHRSRPLEFLKTDVVKEEQRTLLPSETIELPQQELSKNGEVNLNTLTNIELPQRQVIASGEMMSMQFSQSEVLIRGEGSENSERQVLTSGKEDLVLSTTLAYQREILTNGENNFESTTTLELPQTQVSASGAGNLYSPSNIELHNEQILISGKENFDSMTTMPLSEGEILTRGKDCVDSLTTTEFLPKKLLLNEEQRVGSLTVSELSRGEPSASQCIQEHENLESREIAEAVSTEGLPVCEKTLEVENCRSGAAVTEHELSSSLGGRYNICEEDHIQDKVAMLEEGRREEGPSTGSEDIDIQRLERFQLLTETQGRDTSLGPSFCLSHVAVPPMIPQLSAGEDNVREQVDKVPHVSDNHARNVSTGFPLSLSSFSAVTALQAKAAEVDRRQQAENIEVVSNTNSRYPPGLSPSSTPTTFPLNAVRDAGGLQLEKPPFFADNPSRDANFITPGNLLPFTAPCTVQLEAREDGGKWQVEKFQVAADANVRDANSSLPLGVSHFPAPNMHQQNNFEVTARQQATRDADFSLFCNPSFSVHNTLQMGAMEDAGKQQAENISFPLGVSPFSARNIFQEKDINDLKRQQVEKVQSIARNPTQDTNFLLYSGLSQLSPNTFHLEGKEDSGRRQVEKIQSAGGTPAKDVNSTLPLGGLPPAAPKNPKERANLSNGRQQMENVQISGDGCVRNANLSHPLSSSPFSSSTNIQPKATQDIDRHTMEKIHLSADTAVRDLRANFSPKPSPLSADSWFQLPADDDVLSVILGRGTPVIHVAPTPSETPARKRHKPGPKPSVRKRKPICDVSMVLLGEVMRQQQANTSDIRRVRKKAPCTMHEIWAMQRDAHGQQPFCEPSFVGLNEEIRELYHRVFGVGGAKISLASSGRNLPHDGIVKAEPICKTEVESSPDVNECNEPESDVELSADIMPAALPKLVESEILDSEAAHSETKDKQECQELLSVEESTRLDAPICSHQSTWSVAVMEQSSAGATLASDVEFKVEKVEPMDIDQQDQTECVREQNQSLETSHPPEPFGNIEEVQEANSNLISCETCPMGETSSVIPDSKDMGGPSTLLLDSKNISCETESASALSVHNSAPEIQDDAANSNRETGTPIQEVTAECSSILQETTEKTQMHLEGSQLESKVAIQGAGKESHVQVQALDQEAQPQVDVKGKEIEQGLEKECQVIVQGADMQSHAAQEAAKEDQTPTFEVQAPQIPQPKEEVSDKVLEFLEDSRYADDSTFYYDECDIDDEPENDPDAAAGDNSGWSVRTRAVSQYLRSAFQALETNSRHLGEASSPKLGLDLLLLGKTRREAARMFFETLVLKTKDYIHVRQARPYDDIEMSPRAKLMKADT